ncbi:MAG: putative heme d1 biosynthesis radical SAM protein NirJ2 [Bacillota bacterium]
MLVSWNATNACNLSCAHCYRDAGAARRAELDTGEARELIDRVAAAGFKIFIFSGGEPLLREDIYDLVAHACRRGLRPVFGTNGTLITAQVARRLKDAGAAVMGISLDSTDPAAHDRFRGTNGAWEAAVAGMRYCAEAGLPFQVHTTVVDWNYGEVEALTDLAVQLGARGHHVFFLVPTGRAVEIEHTSLRAAQYEHLLRRLLEKQRTTGIEVKPTCAPQFMRIARQLGIPVKYSRGCLAGLAYCLVDPVGNVQPCAYLDVVAGNVREQPFDVIWRTAEVFTRLRTRAYGGACGRCEYRDVCGGCRARAWYYHGDYMAEEPWCLYRPRQQEKSHAAG